jgi:hypothetical protein
MAARTLQFGALAPNNKGAAASIRLKKDKDSTAPSPCGAASRLRTWPARQDCQINASNRFAILAEIPNLDQKKDK